MVPHKTITERVVPLQWRRLADTCHQALLGATARVDTPRGDPKKPGIVCGLLPKGTSHCGHDETADEPMLGDLLSNGQCPPNVSRLRDFPLEEAQDT